MREQIISHFNKGELRSLCFDLEIRYENLPGETLDDKARELINYCDRHGILPTLIHRCKELRPNISWLEDDKILPLLHNTEKSREIDLELGVTPVEPLSHISKRTTLPGLAEVSQGYPHFQLVLRNSSLTPTKHIKLHFEFESFQDYSFRDAAKSDIERLSSPVVKISDGNPFKWQNNKDFVFNGGVDWLLYPNENAIFSFFLKTVMEGQPPVPYDYHFRCTAWAEGIKNLVQRNLCIRVVRHKIKL